ncbi:unnamed protein product, partial [Didymodactylos carnosus]
LIMLTRGQLKNNPEFIDGSQTAADILRKNFDTSVIDEDNESNVEIMNLFDENAQESPTYKPKRFIRMDNRNSNDTQIDTQSTASSSSITKYVPSGNVEVMSSDRKRPAVVMDGFYYNHHVSNKSKAIDTYRCRAGGCGSTSHLHGPDPLKAQLKVVHHELIEELQRNFVPISHAISSKLSKTKWSESKKESLPHPEKWRNFLRFLSIARRGILKLRHRKLPPIPKTENFTIPDQFTKTRNGELFLIHDTTHSRLGGRLLMFSSPAQLKRLFKCEILSCDGTFSSTAKPWKQCYIIMGKVGDILVPLVICLTMCRTKTLYMKILMVLDDIAVSQNTTFLPSSVLSDFEDPWIQAVTAVLPLTKITVCSFHMNQAIYRNVQYLGLAGAYKNEPGIQTVIKKHMALSFLPEQYLKDGIQLVKAETKKFPELVQFSKYFEHTWLHEFPPKLWNVGDLSIRINNNQEGD